MKRILARFAVTIWLLCVYAFGQHADNTVTPPKPPQYFNDFASLVSFEAGERLNRQLAEFDRQTSNQILVVIYPSLPPDTSIEGFCEEAFRAWKPGQQGRNNGAILFVFLKDRKMRIQTGYGLEGALPDAICKRIISDEITPRFQARDFAGGLTAGVSAMTLAIEHAGTEPSNAKDYAKALLLVQKAADAGDPRAMNNLGSMYADGRGVAQDYGKAREWYQKAAD